MPRKPRWRRRDGRGRRGCAVALEGGLGRAARCEGADGSRATAEVDDALDLERALGEELVEDARGGWGELEHEVALG